MQTVPTGFASEPPPGPAMPVMPIPKSAPSRDRAPADSAVATSGETAPCASISAAGTPANAVLASLEYTTSPPSTYAEEPARSVSRPAISPPVQDSAVAIVGPASSRATTSSIVAPSSENRTSPWRARSSASNDA